VRAVELGPNEPANHGVLARVRLAGKDWEDALRSAEAGLALDPEDEDCVNVRAMALTRLGRVKEARSALGGQLARTPEDSLTHANAGWALLNQGEHRGAEEHFREALRLDPTSEYARSGIRQALQARHWFYRPVLRYFLWMARLKDRRQFAVILGAYLVYRFGLGLARSESPLGWLGIALVSVYIAAVALSWFAQPLSAALLSLHPLGKLALTRTERWGERALTVGVLAGLGLLWYGNERSTPALLGGVAILLTCVAATTIRAVDPDLRRVQVAFCALVALLGAGAVWLQLRIEALALAPVPLEGTELAERIDDAEGLASARGALLLISVLAAFWGSQLLAGALDRRVRRG